MPNSYVQMVEDPAQFVSRALGEVGLTRVAAAMVGAEVYTKVVE